MEVTNQWEIKRLATPAAAHSIIKTMIASSNPQTEILILASPIVMLSRQKADRMRKIVTEASNQGREEIRNITVVV